jgi:hypothetical protein
MPNGSAPLFALTSFLKKKKAVAIEHGFFSKRMVFPSVQLTSAATSTDTTLNVVSTQNILKGMVIRADSTNENILVTAVISPTSLGVQRGFGTSPALAISSSVNLWQIGNAFEEGSLRPAAMVINADRVLNATQIFRNSWALTESARALPNIAGDTNLAESKADCGKFHAVDMEKALIFGQMVNTVQNGQPLRAMDGIISQITSRAPGNVVTFGATTNWTQFEAACDPMFNTTTDHSDSPNRVLFVGGFMFRVIQAICRLNSSYSVWNGDKKTEWGMKFGELQLPRGLLRLVEHPLFNAYGQGATWARMGVAVDLASFCIADYRPTTHRGYNETGAMVSDNGIDAVGGTLTTEMTCEVLNPEAMNVMYNATAAAAG